MKRQDEDTEVNVLIMLAYGGSGVMVAIIFKLTDRKGQVANYTPPPVQA